MDISGTLHFYSGSARELFYVMDDDVAQALYQRSEFNVDDVETRRCWISVGADQFIHRRTMNFSRKQTEIKTSLCSRAAKSGLGALTSLYEWYDARGMRPDPFPVLGTLNLVTIDGKNAWELHLTEPVELVVPPGLTRRTKAGPPERKSFEHRRIFSKRDLERIGRVAEKLALDLARSDYSEPEFSCLWRDAYLDSERLEIRKMGIIADIDVWCHQNQSPVAFLEIKAQKIISPRTPPAFYLSTGEWRSYSVARRVGIPYAVWLFQYKDLSDFATARHRLKLMVFDKLDEVWLSPDGYLVQPASGYEVFNLS